VRQVPRLEILLHVYCGFGVLFDSCIDVNGRSVIVIIVIVVVVVIVVIIISLFISERLS